MQIGSERPLIKLHRNDGDVAPRKGMSGWDLKGGSLIYTHEKQHGISNIFKGNTSFSVYDNSFGTYDTTKYYLCFGTYEGKTERFSATNLLHQRQRLLGSFGETGIKSIDTISSVASAVANWPDTIAKNLIIRPKTKFFVGFFSAAKSEPSLVMHNQLDIVAVTMVGRKTLGQIFHKHKGFFQKFA